MLIISVIFGVASVGVGIGNDEPIVIIIIMYLLTGVLPLIISFLLFEGRKAFKFNTSSLRSLLVKQRSTNICINHHHNSYFTIFYR